MPFIFKKGYQDAESADIQKEGWHHCDCMTPYANYLQSIKVPKQARLDCMVFIFGNARSRNSSVSIP